MVRLGSLFFCLLMLHAFATEDFNEDPIIPSTPEQLATLYASQSYLIGGLISPLSGQLSLSQVDLDVKGSTPFNLSRTYIFPSIPSEFPRHKKKQEEWNKYHLTDHVRRTYRGWTYFPHFILEYFSSGHIRFTDRLGATLNFTLSGEIGTLSSNPYALNNASGDFPSGRSDPRNTQVRRDFSTHTFNILTPDGTTYIYGHSYTSSSRRCFYLLLKEIQPSGKVLKYTYHKNQLTSIEAKDPKERFTYGALTINKQTNLSGGCIFFNSSYGNRVAFIGVKRPSIEDVFSVVCLSAIFASPVKYRGHYFRSC